MKEWLLSHGIDPSVNGTQANSDGDDQNNELEWIFGTDLLSPDSPIRSVVTSGSEMTLDYTRRKQTGANVYAEWSPDLTELSWDGDGLTELVTDDDGEIETVTVTVPMNLGQKYVRVRAER